MRLAPSSELTIDHASAACARVLRTSRSGAQKRSADSRSALSCSAWAS
jgi:hypothetical protein